MKKLIINNKRAFGGCVIYVNYLYSEVYPCLMNILLVFFCFPSQQERTFIETDYSEKYCNLYREKRMRIRF